MGERYVSDHLGLTMIGSEWFGSRAGGLNRYFDSLGAALAARPDVELDAWAFGIAPRWGRSLGPLGGSLPARMMAAPARPRARPDVVDRHFSPYGRRLPRGSGSAVRVFHFQGPWAAESEAAGGSARSVRVKRAMERSAYRSVDRFVVLSQAFAEILVEDYHVSRDRISVIPPGVDLERFSSGGAPASAPTVLCVRRLEHRMGIDVLLRAWPAVLDVHPDARLRIAGTGTAEAELRRLAAAMPTVRFLGRISDEDLVSEYAAAALTVIPTRALEGFGLIALESLASGRAPVVTNTGGLPDAVRGLDPSLVVPTEQPEALAARLITALAGDLPSPEACRAHAEGFSWDACADRHVRMYRDLVRASR
jgi:glycosyltransferase involved in cell wall biosynthesis